MRNGGGNGGGSVIRSGRRTPRAAYMTGTGTLYNNSCVVVNPFARGGGGGGGQRSAEPRAG